MTFKRTCEHVSKLWYHTLCSSLPLRHTGASPSCGGPSQGSERREITSITAATKAAAAKMKNVKARRSVNSWNPEKKSSKSLRSETATNAAPMMLGNHVKKGRTAAKIREGRARSASDRRSAPAQGRHDL